jgi:hypothetical protein
MVMDAISEVCHCLVGKTQPGVPPKTPVLCVTYEAGHPLSRNYQIKSTPDLT